MEFMITPWAAYGIQFRFSGIETGAVAMHCYKEGKKDWIRLGRAWHKIVHTCKGFVYTRAFVMAHHQPQPHGETEVKDL